MNRLFLLFHGRFPSEKAASLFTAKGAQAFARAGLKVTVVVPKRRGITEKDPFAFYNIGKDFEVRYIPTIDIFGFVPAKIAFLVSFAAFSIAAFFFIKKESGSSDIIYSNESLPLFLISSVRPNCFFEMHDFPQSKFGLYALLLKKMKWVLVHNRWKLAEIDRRFPFVSREKFLYEPNAVDIADFDMDTSRNEAREKVGLPYYQKIAVYTGHLYGWKGVDTLAQAAEILGDSYSVVFVGGTNKDVETFREKYGSIKKIVIVGHRPHKEIPLWQKAADVLVLPNTGRAAISTHYTSPMKLFEYMASKRPIVASNIPSICEIVDDKSAVLVSPDDPEVLAKAIEDLAKDEERGKRLAETAYEDVLKHTWQARAERILNFIRKA